MSLKLEKRDGSRERRILIGMIVDRTVLARIASQWNKDGLFRSRWANMIGGWSVQFYKRYGDAPRESIETRFESWSQDNKDKETVKLVEKFLHSISDQYERESQVNSEVLIDDAGDYFERVRIERLKQALEGDLDSGETKKAIERVTKFTRIAMGGSGAVDVLNQKELFVEAFKAKGEPLIKYEGALGNFLNEALERDSLLAFTGPEKRGKSFWLQDLAWRGMLQGRRVAFFEVGDMSRNQIMRRFMVRASRRPWHATTGNANDRYNKPIRIPKWIESPPNDKVMANVDFKEYNWDEPLSWKYAWKACQKIYEKTGGQSLLRLAVFPNSTISISGIESHLQQYDNEGWTPDVIVIDYADILAPLDGSAETRDQINATWKAMRRLSQVRHCLVATATQTNAASYDTSILGRKNFSEDKRKHAHVTAMVGLNQTDPEKENGITRLNWLDLREGDFSVSKCVHVAGCLALANPAMKSTF